MKLENRGKPFLVEHNGRGYDLPTGIFEVEDVVGYHIISVVSRWNEQRPFTYELANLGQSDLKDQGDSYNGLVKTLVDNSPQKEFPKKAEAEVVEEDKPSKVKKIKK